MLDSPWGDQISVVCSECCSRSYRSADNISMKLDGTLSFPKMTVLIRVRYLDTDGVIRFCTRKLASRSKKKS